MTSGPLSCSAPSPRARVWEADLALVAVTAIWGLTFAVVKNALADASPLLFNAVRMVLAALLLAALYWRRLRGLAPGIWRAGAVTGLLMAAGYGFQTAGLAATTAAKSAFLTGLSVVLVPFLVALLLRQIPALSTWTGAVMALGGLYLLAFFPAGAGWRAAWQAPSPGDLLTILCALCFAGHIVALGHYSPRFSFQPLAVLMIAFCALFTCLSVPVLAGMGLEAPRLHFTPRLWGALLLTAALATAVAFTVQAWAQQFTPATHTAIVFSLEPVFGLAGAVGWLQESVSRQQLAGCGLILGAILLVELLAARRRRAEAMG